MLTLAISYRGKRSVNETVSRPETPARRVLFTASSEEYSSMIRVHGGRWGKGVEVWHTSDDVRGCTNPISFHRRSLRYSSAENNEETVTVHL
jgi:hypothetical protein